MNKKKDPPSPAEQTGPVVYCGPTLPGVARQYTVYHNSIPAPLAAALADNPALRGLVLPLDRLPEARRDIAGRTGRFYRLYQLANRKEA